MEIVGCSDANVIVYNSANLFPESSSQRNGEFTRTRKPYCGSPLKDECTFDVELERGRAVGLGRLAARQIIHCHPIIMLCILAKLT